MSRQLGFKSVATVEKYLNYLEEAYLVYPLSRYSHKAGARLSSPKKAYLVDNGYIAAKAVQFSNNNGKLLENLVFSELLKAGYQSNHNLFYYKTRNDKEVDFVLREGLSVKTLIQVAYRVDELGVKEREIKALVEAGEELKCEELIVLTWDYQEDAEWQGKKIKFLPVWQWLLK